MRSSNSPRWVSFFLLLVLGFVLVQLAMMLLDPKGVPRWLALESRLEKVQQENEDKREDLRLKQQSIERLRRSPRFVERVAREQLGLISEGEVIIQFPRRR